MPKNDNKSTMTVITETRPQDILCGKEKHCVSHQGSLDFRVVIDQYASKYAEAITKQEKMNVTKEIYDMLGAKNARFLKMNQKTKAWEELSSLLARDKISHALRFANREKKSGASTTVSEKRKSSGRGHRRTGSNDSNSTLTTVATELSLDEFENLMMDDEPLEWQAAIEDAGSDNSSSEPRPYVYEVPAHYHHGPPPPPPPPYYHQHAYAPRPYYYPHTHSPSYHPPAHYGPPPPQHHYHPYPPVVEQQEPEEPMDFPEKPLPAPPARNSTMDVDLTYMMSEPLMEWELDTEEVLFVR